MVNLLGGNILATIRYAVLDQGEYYKCNHWGKQICDIGKHFVMDCSKTNRERNNFYEKLDDIISTEESCHIHNLDDDDKYDCLLGCSFIRRVNDEYDIKSRVLLLVASMIYDICRKISTLNINGNILQN